MPGAPALLDQHVPHLAAGASVPLHRHNGEINTRARQRELDARAPVRAGVAAVRRRHQEALPVISAERQRFGRASTTRVELLCMSGRELPHVMAMLIPEAWDAEHAHEPGEAGVLRISRVADGAVGRPRRGRVHRRPRDRRDARSQRPASRRATWSRTTTWSSWRRKPACCRSSRRT